jgi:hypothetical protein
VATHVLSWNPAPLSAAIARGYRASMEVAAREADAAGGDKAGAELRGNARVPTGLGPIFEVGAQPHRIEPTGRVLFLRGLNVYVTGGVEHPGRAAHPYLRPVAAGWPLQAPGIMRPFLAAAGF